MGPPSAALPTAYARSGSRVNAVNPTHTATGRMTEGLEAQARQDGITVEEARRGAASGMPLQRLATPEEVADVVVYLSSARASYVSGSIVNVDGASAPAVV